VGRASCRNSLRAGRVLAEAFTPCGGYLLGIAAARVEFAASNRVK
jgi:hypothetical protein